MRYGIHSELKDGTFVAEPSTTYSNKREACRVAKIVAKATQPWSDTARILVCDAGLNTVAVFNPPKQS